MSRKREEGLSQSLETSPRLPLRIKGCGRGSTIHSRAQKFHSQGVATEVHTLATKMHVLYKEVFLGRTAKQPPLVNQVHAH